MRGAVLLAVAFVCIVSSAMASVLAVRTIVQLKPHELVYSQLLWPLGLNCIVWPGVWALRYMGHLRRDDDGNNNRDMPRSVFLAEADEPRADTWKWLVLAFIAEGSTLLLSLPASYVPGPMQTLLSQLAIPTMLLMSVVFLRVHYRPMHYFAALVIVGGVAIDLVPAFEGMQPGSTSALWVGMYICGVVNPFGVLREKWIKHSGMHVWHFRASYAPYEMLFGWALVPFIFVPLPHRATVSPASLPSNILTGLQCFVGQDVTPSGYCPGTMWVFLAMVILSELSNVTNLYIVKHNSASLAVMVTAAKLPTTVLLFQFEVLAGPSKGHHTLTWFTLASTAVVLFGIVLFRAVQEHVYHPTNHGRSEEEAVYHVEGGAVCDANAPLIQAG